MLHHPDHLQIHTVEISSEDPRFETLVRRLEVTKVRDSKAPSLMGVDAAFSVSKFAVVLWRD